MLIILIVRNITKACYMTYNIYVEFMDGIWEPTCHVVIDNAYNELHRL